MTLEAESNIAGLELMIRLLTTTFFQGFIPRLTKSRGLPDAELYLLKFEIPAFGEPETK